MLRKVSKHPAGSHFIYLPKSWVEKQTLAGWDNKKIKITPSSRLLIEPYPKNQEAYITTRTPLRLPFGGGGSDIPEYYTKNGEGFWISGSINHYIHIILKKRFEEESKFVWAKTEYVTDSSEFTHPILRAILTKHNLVKHIELISIGDLPARIGLGSSGSFTVGLLNAVYQFRKEKTTPQLLAEEAFEVERFTLGRKIGKQDQYIASEGGLREFHIDIDGNVTSKLLSTSIKSFEKWLLLFYVDQRQIEVDKAIRTMSLNDYKKTSSLTNKIFDALQNNNFQQYGELLDQHWKTKSKGQPEHFSTLINLAKQNGAIGGKLCGAGGGGCILLVCPPERQTSIIEVMEKAKTKYIPFNFTQFGSECY